MTFEFVVRLFHFSKAFLIVFATIAGSFCAEPINVEANTQQSVKEAQPQKRHIGISALNDCDGPTGVVGLHGGLHSDVAVHGDLALGLHGVGHGYAPAYGGGYLASGALLSPVGHVGGLGHLGSVGHIAGIGGSIGHLGAVVAAPHAGYISGGYAPHAPVLASSIVSHAPVVAPTVRHFFSMT